MPREYHKDGSYTDRYESGSCASVTRNADGSIREQTNYETGLLEWRGLAVTTDDDGKVLHTEKRG